jgi:hypothetical protein
MREQNCRVQEGRGSLKGVGYDASSIKEINPSSYPKEKG